MAEDQFNLPGEAGEANEPSLDEAPAPPLPPWRHLWQVPVLIVGLLLFSLGLLLMNRTRQQPTLGDLLDEASTLVAVGRYDDARAYLSRATELADKSHDLQRARYDLIWGDLVYLEQKVKGWDNADNHAQVVHRYEQAQKLGWRLDAARLQRWAETLVALDKFEPALDILAGIEEPSPQRRYQVIRQMIERRLARGMIGPDLLDPLVDRFARELAAEANDAIRRNQSIWAASVRAGARLELGNAQGVIDQLIRQIQLFRDQAGDDDLAPLFVHLARAYQRVGDLDKAQFHYRLAEQKIRPDEPGTGEAAAQIMVGLGQIALATPNDRGEPEGVRLALDYFTRAETAYRATHAYLEALLGRADCEARLGLHADAVEHFGQAIRKLAGVADLSSPRVTQMIRQQHAQHFAREDYALALEYIRLLEPLYRSDWPPEPLEQLAQTYQALAQQTQVRAAEQAQRLQAAAAALADRSAADGDAAPAPVSAADTPDPAAIGHLRRQAARQFDQAGELFLRHAQALTINQPRAYGQSLWTAAQCFELAQNWKQAIEVLAQFARTLPTAPRRLEAVHRLGLAHLADGQYAVAGDLFKYLIDEHPQSPDALASHVPLARCQIAQDRPEDARRQLKHVLSEDPAIRPESNEYRQALIEMGRLLYRLGDYEPAISHLHEAAQRYADGPEAANLCFMLADAYRQSVGQLDADLRQHLPLSRRQAVASERTRRLEEARNLYGQVVVDLNRRHPHTLSDLDRLQLRNAHFYKADCAYDLGRFEQAIRDYDDVARHYEDHPASLMALVQIVNAYCELGRLQEARAANDRARAHLKRIPQEAFNDPGLPMNRQHWEDWLRFTGQFALFKPDAVGLPLGGATGRP